MPMQSRFLPLDGVTVVALEHAVAVPFATRQLADLGARVIKVERPDGGDFARGYDDAINGELSSIFVWVGRGKESVALDLKNPLGRKVLDRALETADIFIQNLSPGAVDRLGYGADILRERYPRLIVVSSSGYGSPGPYTGKRAYDALVQCESGLVATTGTKSRMIKPGFSAADIASGMYMYAAVLMALYQRERTGVGTVIEISMMDAITDWFAHHIYFAQHTGTPAERVDMGHPALTPYGAFPTLDGQTVVIGVQNDREWARLCEVLLELPELPTDPRFATNIARNRNRQFVEDLVSEATSKLRSDELTDLLEGVSIATARINSLVDAANHPQHAARESWVDVDSPAGPVKMFRQVIREEGKEYPAGPVPALGEHTGALLEELGYRKPEVADLQRSGAVAISLTHHDRRHA